MSLGQRQPKLVDYTHELTEREREVFFLFLQGYSAAQIGKKLDVTEETIKSHRKKIIAKHGARNMVHAATIYYVSILSPGQLVELPSIILQKRLSSRLTLLMKRLEEELNEELEELLKKAMRDLRN